MRIFKTKVFARWAAKEGLTDRILRAAIQENNYGLVADSLGGHVYKLRVALPGRGKRGSARTIVAYRQEDKAFFVYGFAKNEKANIAKGDLTSLRLLARQLLSYGDTAIKIAIEAGELVGVRKDD